MYPAVVFFAAVQFIRYASPCIPVRDPGGVVPIESPLTCAPSTAAASLFVDDTVSFTSARSSLIRKCTTCAGGTVNYYEPGRSQYYTSSESIGSISLSQCSNLCICTPSGICYIKSSTTRTGRSVVREQVASEKIVPPPITGRVVVRSPVRPPPGISSSEEIDPIPSVPSGPSETTTSTTTTTTTTTPVPKISLYPYCSDGTCAVYGYIESGSIKLDPENGIGVTYSNSDISVPVTDSENYINVATISCDGCIQSYCQRNSE